MIEVKEKNFKAPAQFLILSEETCYVVTEVLTWCDLIGGRLYFLEKKWLQYVTVQHWKNIFQNKTYSKIIRISSSLEETIWFLEIK